MHKIEVWNAAGILQEVHEASGLSVPLQAEHLPKGLYLLKVETESGSALLKWIKE